MTHHHCLAALMFVAVLPTAAPAADDVQRCMGRSYDVPSGLSVVCSATWRFTGPCDGTDLWDRWTVEGAGADGPFVRPWLDQRMVVVGYEMVKTAGDPHSFFMIGSGIQPDAFLWMPPGVNHARMMFPPGLGHPWPSKLESEAQRKSVNDLIDIHGACAPTTQMAKARGFFMRLKTMITGVRPTPETPAPVQSASIFLTIYFIPWGRTSELPPLSP